MGKLVNAFRERSKEAFVFLDDLARVETVAMDRPSFLQTTLPASRAASFIVFYNAIEASMSDAVKFVRADIGSSRRSHRKIDPIWRKEVIRLKLRYLFESGGNYENIIRDVDAMISTNNLLKDLAEVQKLPFSGNVSGKEITRWLKELSVEAAFPKFSRGGSELDLIAKHRNRLAHGDDNFVETGNVYTVRELRKKFFRARAYMKSVLFAVERYCINKSYVVASKRK